MAVTKILLRRDQIDLLTRVSTITRLSPNRYLMRIDVLRLLIEEFLYAGLEPARITSISALSAAIQSHLSAALLTERPIAWLVACIERQAQRESKHPALALARRRKPGGRPDGLSASHQSLTARLRMNDLVAIDTFRCDVREYTGFSLSRSVLIRVLIDSFIRVSRLTEPTIGPRTRSPSAVVTAPGVQ